MKKLKIVKKPIAILLAVLIILGSMSVASTFAASITANDVGANATIVDLGANINSNVVESSNSLNVTGSSSYKVYWNKELEYTNVVNNRKETYYAKQYLMYHEVSGTPTWCVQPYNNIQNSGYTSYTNNNDYFTNLKNNHKSLYNAIAKTIYISKMHDEKSKGAYYFATQLLIYDYIMGLRYTTIGNKYNLKKGKSSTLSYITGTHYSNIKTAMTTILKELRKDKVKLPSNWNKTIARAEKYIASKKASKCIKLEDIDPLGKTKPTYKFVKSKKISLGKNADAYTYTFKLVSRHKNNQNKYVESVVSNKEDKEDDNSKDIKFTRSGNTFTVSSKFNLQDKYDNGKGYSYYIKAEKTKEYTEKTSVYVNTKKESSQVLANDLKYSESCVGYYPILYKSTPKTAASLTVKKTAKQTIEKQTSTYTDDLSDWAFKVTYGNESTILTTDEDGTCDTIDDIDTTNSKVSYTVKELGKVIDTTDEDYNPEDYTNITEDSDNEDISYGFPKYWSDVTGTQKGTIAKGSTKTVTLTHENKYAPPEKPFTININKSVTDGASVSGYYFLLVSKSTSLGSVSGTSQTLKIVGPTDNSGTVSTTLTEYKPSANSQLEVIELGKKLEEHSTPTVPTNYSQSTIKTVLDNLSTYFEIPKQYDQYAITEADSNGIRNLTAYDITSDDVENKQIDVDIENTTSFQIKLTKMDSTDSRKPIAGAKYEVYSLIGNDTRVKKVEDTITTDENGVAKSKLLRTGTYYVKEISCPANYILDNEEHEVVGTASENYLKDNEYTNVKSIEVTDKPTDVIINKQGVWQNGDKKALKGATFDIYECSLSDYQSDKKPENPLKTVTTDDNGKYELKGVLEQGKTYTFVETSAPSGYKLADPKEYTVKDTAETQTVNIEDKTTVVKFIKYKTNTTEKVSGALLKIYKVTNKNDSEDTSKWTIEDTDITVETKDDYVTIEGQLIENQTYLLKETKTPNGYATCDPIPFTVDKSSEIQTVTVYDDTIKIKITKIDKDSQSTLKGCTLALYDGDTEVCRWNTSDENPKTFEKDEQLVPKKYILKELEVPAGYTKSADKEIEIKDTGDLQTFEMENKKFDVQVDKVDDGGGLIKGAKLQILDESKKNVILEWDSDTFTKHIKDTLKINTKYYLHEKKAPNGYATADDIGFTINENGKIMQDGKGLLGAAGEVEKLEMEDDPIDVTVSKTLKTNDKAEIPDAEFTLYQVTDTNDSEKVTDWSMKEVKKWTSRTSTYEIKGELIAGAKYVIKETKAPDGYTTANAYSFNVENTSEKKHIAIKDDYTHIIVNKLDENNKALSGGEFELKDSKNNTIQVNNQNTWTTPQTIDGLVVGQTYYVYEVKAPNGYTKLSSPYSFTVKDNNKSKQVENITDSPTDVQFQKYDKNHNALSGAILQIQDESGNPIEIKDDNGNVIETTDNNGNKVKGFKTDKDKPFEVKGQLNVDTQYKLVELQAPSGYVKASEPKPFTLNNTSSLQTIELSDEQTHVKVLKKDKNSDTYLTGAVMQIKDKDTENQPVVKVNGKETFSPSTEGQDIYGLVAGKTYILHEVTAPTGYKTAPDKEFTVEDTTDVQTVVMEDEQTEVKILKTNEEDKALKDASLQILDTTNGNTVVKELTSKEETLSVKGLSINTPYILHETNAPSGYTLANDIKFKIVLDNGVQKVQIIKDDNTTTDVDVITMKDTQTEVKITKLGEDNEVLKGAELQLTNSSGKIVQVNGKDSWTSDEQAQVVKGLPVGQYTLSEIKAPNGYYTTESKSFEVTNEKKTVEITLSDKQTVANITKYDITDSKELAGAKLKVYEKDNPENVIDEWESTTKAHNIKGRLIVNKWYVLSETTAPNGYTTAENIEFQLDDDYKVAKTVNMYDKPTEVEISKVDEKTKEKLAGAELQLKDSSGNVVEVDDKKSWLSDDTAQTFKGLTVGETYTLSELNSPDTYDRNDSVQFTVLNDNKTKQSVSIADDKTKVQITKADATTGEELSGASLKVTDKDGNEIDTWVSDAENPHIIEGLVIGQTYTLSETTAPNGYATTESITFTVDNDYKAVQKVVMKDKPTQVQIAKVNENGEKLAGAELQLKDSAGNVVKVDGNESWTTTTKPVVLSGLVAGQEYTLTELSAPNGYYTTESSKFTLLNTSDVQLVELTDKETVVNISKTDITNGKELKGAKLKVVKKSDNKDIIDQWVSTDEVHQIVGKLNVNEEYTLIEETSPNGYTVAESVDFTVNDDYKVSQTVEMKDSPTQVEILKIDENDKSLSGAKLKLVDEKGKKVDKWTSKKDGHLIKGKLCVGKTYTLKEVKSPNGYEMADDITFTVENTDSKQLIKMTDKSLHITLPKTGGHYNPIIYIVCGVILIVLATTIIVGVNKPTKTKKRKH